MFHDDYESQLAITGRVRVQVYKNLHQQCWSVRSGGRVKFYCNKIVLRDCRYNVGEAGRLRVIREGRKNVHAYISGYLCSVDRVTSALLEAFDDHNSYFKYCGVYYNPKKFQKFVDIETGLPILTSDFCDMRYGYEYSAIAIWRETKPILGVVQDKI